jgi:zinc protease
MPNQYDYSRLFFKRFYRPEYATIVVVGDVTPDKVNKLAEKYFGDWKRGDYVADIPKEPVQKETRYTHIQNSSIPPYFSLNYKGPAFSDKEIDMPALDALATILFSQNSDLYKKLIIREKKARFIGGGAFDSKDPNLFSIQASLIKKEDMQYVKDEIIKAIDDVKENGVNEKLLSETKSNLKYSFAMRIDNPDQIASTLCHYIALTSDPETLNRTYELYEKVTVEDVRSVAKKYFVPTGLTIATISPDEKGGLK